MFDEDFNYEENLQPIARCAECGALIYENSSEIYMDDRHNYFCCHDCADYYHGIFLAEDCLIAGEQNGYCK